MLDVMEPPAQVLPIAPMVLNEDEPEPDRCFYCGAEIHKRTYYPYCSSQCAIEAELEGD